MRKPTFAALGLSLALAAAVLAAPARAEASDYASDKGFGLGLILGEPTGLTMEYMFGGGHAIQGHLAFALVHHDMFLIMVDYLWHPSVITSTDALDLSWHIGVGGVFGFWTDDYYYDGYNCYDANPDPRHEDWVCRDYHHARAMFGIHFPVGLNLMFRSVPIELFFELALGIEFYPELPDLLGHGGIGARYFF